MTAIEEASLASFVRAGHIESWKTFSMLHYQRVERFCREELKVRSADFVVAFWEAVRGMLWSLPSADTFAWLCDQARLQYAQMKRDSRQRRREGDGPPPTEQLMSEPIDQNMPEAGHGDD